MNNDIARDMNSYIKVPVGTGANNALAKAHKEEAGELLEDCVENKIDMEKSMNCMLGKLQAGSGYSGQKSVRRAVEEFLNNSDYIEAHNNFCDELIKQGYSLEEALLKTDMVFKSLAQESTY